MKWRWWKIWSSAGVNDTCDVLCDQEMGLSKSSAFLVLFAYYYTPYSNSSKLLMHCLNLVGFSPCLLFVSLLSCPKFHLRCTQPINWKYQSIRFLSTYFYFISRSFQHPREHSSRSPALSCPVPWQLTANISMCVAISKAALFHGSEARRCSFLPPVCNSKWWVLIRVAWFIHPLSISVLKTKQQ